GGRVARACAGGRALGRLRGSIVPRLRTDSDDCHRSLAARADAMEPIMPRTWDIPTNPPESAPEACGAIRRLARATARALRNGVNAWMMRRAMETLHALDDRMLQDIGIGRSEIESCVRVRMMRHW